VGKLLVATADAFGDEGEKETCPRKTRKPVVSESLALSEAEWAESIPPKQAALQRRRGRAAELFR
jgi:hypothetical protein